MRYAPLLVLALVGCGYAPSGWYAKNVQDVDGDGELAVRFGGDDCADDDPSIVTCDADGDGEDSPLAGGNDCDDADASIRPGAPEICDGIDNDCDGFVDNDDEDVVSDETFFVDADGDGAGDPNRTVACQVLLVEGDPESGLFAASGDDCDDTTPSVRPTAEEVCDGVDNDCDGVTDDAGLWFVDDDGDGFGVDGSQVSGPCVLVPGLGLANRGGDCDDTDEDHYPGAPELPYDGVDANCNGLLDDYDRDFDGHVPDTVWHEAVAANDAAGGAWSIARGDCNDENPAQYDGNTEICDGVDNDCDGSVDAEDLSSAGPGDEAVLRGQLIEVYIDLDADGFFGTPVEICPIDFDSSIHSELSNDCVDGQDGAPDPTAIHPGAPEVCDGLDNDCDGRTDWSFEMFDGSSEHFLDGDSDTIGAAAVFACGVDPSANIVAVGGDCNDANPTAFPGAVEICGDAIRQDCTDASLFDCDGDGHEAQYAIGGSPGDCDDRNIGVHPDADEVCDGLDNDCDSLVDSADDVVGPTPTWYPDEDADGFGVAPSTVVECDRPDGSWSIVPGDCDDSDPGVTPATPWYADLDGDGFGTDASAAEWGCSPPGPEWVRQGGDCDDNDPALHPDSLWYVDLDGDGAGDPNRSGRFCLVPDTQPWVLASEGADCDDADPTLQGALTFYADADSDGFGDAEVTASACTSPVIDGVRYVSVPGDCVDADPTVHPERDEVCNGIDDDCDGAVDDADPDRVPPIAGVEGFEDLDGDGFGDDSASQLFCFSVPTEGWSGASGDCDDADAGVFPGAIEICANGVDEDCDGSDSTPSWYVDADGDGFGVGAAVVEDCDPPADGTYATRSGDCDDTEAFSFPGASERDLCDAIDDDCDGAPEPLLTWFFDGDGDTYGDDATASAACTRPLDPPTPGATGTWVLRGGDCDDADADNTFGRLWFEDADEDGLGSDASTRFACPQFDALGAPLTQWMDGGRIWSVFGGDCDDTRPGVGLAEIFYEDVDGDSWGSPVSSLACPDALGGPPAGLVERTGDCDDDDSSISPSAVEVDGDGVDQDCDGFDDALDGVAWYPDADGDGFGDSTAAGGAYSPGFVDNSADCDDGNSAILNGIVVYVDADLDTYGAGSPMFVGRCSVAPGESLDALDCDDGAAAVNPAAASDACDGVDTDCDGTLDEDGWIAGFVDADGDGYGTVATSACPDSEGFATVGGDCRPADPTVNPGAAEVCDGIDNDCDGSEPTSSYYPDFDGDGFGAEDLGLTACEAPGPDWLSVGLDCDDLDPLTFDGAPELCDGIDNDCDGVLPGEEGDADGDGFSACEGDCNTDRADVFPGAVEACDGVDNNCDGVRVGSDFDVSDPSTAGPSEGTYAYAVDLDGDGFYAPDALMLSCRDLGVSGSVTVPAFGDVAFADMSAVDEMIGCDLTAGQDTGILYVPDTDGDATGTFASVTDFVVPCGDAPPTGYTPWGSAQDCAPDDPDRSFLAVSGSYADLDGDGAVGVYTPPGTCVGGTISVPGGDCDDSDPGQTGPHAASPITVTDNDAMSAYLAGCRSATFELGPEVDIVNPAEIGEETALVFRQTHDVASCDATATAGCVRVDGRMADRADVTFEDIQVTGSVATPDGGSLTFRGATLYEFEILADSTCDVLLEEVDSYRSSGVVLTTELTSSVEIRGSTFAGETEGMQLSSFGCSITDTEFHDFAAAVAFTHDCDLTDVRFFDVDNAIRVDSADVDADGLSDVHRGLVTRTAFVLDGGELHLQNADLSSSERSGSFFAVNEGTLRLDGVRVDGSGAATFITSGTSGVIIANEVDSRSMGTILSLTGDHDVTFTDLDVRDPLGGPQFIIDGPDVLVDGLTSDDTDPTAQPFFSVSSGDLSVRNADLGRVVQAVEQNAGTVELVDVVLEASAVSNATFALGGTNATLENLDFSGTATALIETKDTATTVVASGLRGSGFTGRMVDTSIGGSLTLVDSECLSCGGGASVIRLGTGLTTITDGYFSSRGSILDIGGGSVGVTGSRLQSVLGTTPVIELHSGDLDLDRTTVFDQFAGAFGVPLVVLDVGTQLDVTGSLLYAGPAVDGYSAVECTFTPVTITDTWSEDASQLSPPICAVTSGLSDASMTGPLDIGPRLISNNPNIAPYYGSHAN